ncbi:MAG: phage tail sheath subtilisin-like domain-containing protein [Burkholderiales bacterium]
MRYGKPGTYIERVDASRALPVVLRTDIAAFVGIARRGPLDTPVPVESMRQFAAHFGGYTGAGYLAYAVNAFFENGGRRCWVVRVAARQFDGGDGNAGAAAARLAIADGAGRPALAVSACSPGAWGNGLTLQWALSRPATTTTIAAASAPQYAMVASSAGFAADELVRIERPGDPAATRYRVVAAVDGDAQRLYWVHPDATRRRDTDLALFGIDPLASLRITRVAYTLTVREGGDVVAHYADLHLPVAHPRCIANVLQPARYPAARLGRSAVASDAAAGADAADDLAWPALPRAPELVVVTSTCEGAIPRPLAVPLDALQSLTGGRDGLATLTADDFVGEPFAPDDSDFARTVKSRGLQALALVDEIALVAVPDILIRPDPDPEYRPVPEPPPNPCIGCPPPAPPRSTHTPKPIGELPPIFADDDIARVQAALVAQCEAAGDRVALLALPYPTATSPAKSRADMVAWRERFDSRCAALYAPWLDVAEPRDTAPTRTVPPCGHVAGAIARTDLAIGVQRAPANVDLAGIVAIRRAVDDALHGELNDANVNVLRTEFGRSPSLAGARTLSYDPLWRYVNVVRLMLTIKKAANLVLQWSVFEPNDEASWAGVQSALLAVMNVFWARGAFAGETPEEGFFIRCDDTTNPPDARERGELVALLGFAPVAPAEFIVLRVGRQQAVPLFSLFRPEEAPA